MKITKKKAAELAKILVAPKVAAHKHWRRDFAVYVYGLATAALDSSILTVLRDRPEFLRLSHRVRLSNWDRSILLPVDDPLPQEGPDRPLTVEVLEDRFNFIENRLVFLTELFLENTELENDLAEALYLLGTTERATQIFPSLADKVDLLDTLNLNNLIERLDL